MRAWMTRLPLLVLLVAAVLLLAGSVWLSRREHLVRLPRDREPLLRLAAELQKELLGLEGLHEQHLLALAGKANADDQARTQWACDNIVGVVECSFLFADRGRSAVHVRMSGVEPGSYLRPTFEVSASPRFDVVLLDQEALLGKPADFKGWMDEPGKPLMFWMQKTAPTRLVVLTIEVNQVREAMREALVSSIDSKLAQFESVKVLGPDEYPVKATASHTGGDMPHWTQSLPTRYGTWQVAAWDKEVTRVNYHQPTWMGGLGLAALLAMMGGMVDAHQRRAQRLAAQRVSFVNRVSHELRTPLTNMLLNLDMVEEALPEPSSGRKRLLLVKEEAGRLARLVENVLTFTRQEQGSLVLSGAACLPAQVVDAVLDQFAASFSRRGIIVERHHEGENDALLLDADALSQITANLLSNVEKYAPQATARVRTEQRGPRYVLQVADSGPGIAPEDRERIFAPFVRVDDRVTAGVTGTGLGLSIARELAEKMGGSLRLEATNEGACFTVELNGEIEKA